MSPLLSPSLPEPLGAAEGVRLPGQVRKHVPDQTRKQTTDQATDDGRHRGLAVLARQLELVLLGRAADLLLQGGIPEGPHRVVVLPVWDWRLPAMEVGRKAQDRLTGATLLLPVRLDWGGNEALVRLEPADAPAQDYAWMAQSLGWEDEGATTAPTPTCSITNWQHTFTSVTSTSTVRTVITSGSVLRIEVERTLKALSRAGAEAEWQFLIGLEPFVTSTVHKAHSAVCHEIGELRGRVVDMLDETGLEQVVNVMMFGAVGEGPAAPSSARRMLELCLRPECFRRVDPMMYIHVHLRRDAEDEVRRAVGDPRIGRKVRRVAAQMPGATVDEVVREYRIQHPQDRLSVSRAEAALSVGADAMARSVMLDPETNGAAR